MKDSFNDYKKIIESNVTPFTYLYDGDVISSSEEIYASIVKNPTVSPKFIIECIKDIYSRSIDIMIDRSIQYNVNINLDDFKSGKKSISRYINSLHSKFDPSYIFISDKSLKIFSTKLFENEDKIFPNYFDPLVTWSNLDIKTYYSPNIIDLDDEVHIYITDKSIQSLVYGIQNMEYNIEAMNDGFKHSIRYPLYRCDYTCYKLVIKNLNKIREDKLNKILDGN